MSEALHPRLHAVRPDLADSRLEGQVAAARFVAPTPRRVVAAS
ncbi:MAG: peptidase P60, partial [Bauldia litoralis]